MPSSTCGLIVVLAISQVACATIDCDREAREAATTGGEQAGADARRSCEERLADGRKKLEEDEKEREAAERRDAFRNRNDGRRR